ncbi:MAG TPA: hypothetical protein DIV86_02235 [Alphaproteobacteria bacterium]|nr:hypothetical protein [Alphaproteobacteria bacterium]
MGKAIDSLLNGQLKFFTTELLKELEEFSKNEPAKINNLVNKIYEKCKDSESLKGSLGYICRVLYSKVVASRFKGGHPSDENLEFVLDKLSSSVDVFRGESNLSTYIYNVVKNAIIDTYRARGKESKFAKEYVRLNNESDGPLDILFDPENEVSAEEIKNFLITKYRKKSFENCINALFAIANGVEKKEALKLFGFNPDTSAYRTALGRLREKVKQDFALSSGDEDLVPETRLLYEIFKSPVPNNEKDRGII